MSQWQHLYITTIIESTVDSAVFRAATAEVGCQRLLDERFNGWGRVEADQECIGNQCSPGRERGTTVYNPWLGSGPSGPWSAIPRSKL